MKTGFSSFGSTPQLVLALCVGCSIPNPWTTTAAVAQTADHRLERADHPGGKAHTNRADKEKLKEFTLHYAAVHYPDASRQPSGEDPRFYYIDRQIIEEILKQKGCIGLRIYPAYKNEAPPYKPRLLLVGVEKGPDADTPHKDQITTYEDKINLFRKECTIGETDDRCPDNCNGTSF